MIDEKEMQKMAEFIQMRPVAIGPIPPELIGLLGADCQFHGDDEDEDKRISVTPKRIVKSGKATIVFWKDGDKTIVKRSPDEPDNDYAAFTAALAKRVYGSNSQIKHIIEDLTVTQKPKKWRPIYKKEPTTAADSLNGIKEDFDKFTEAARAFARSLAIENDACPVDKPCKEQKTVEVTPVRIEDESKLSAAEKSYLEWTMKNLNEKAQAQYAAHKLDMWTCPKCGKTYPWQTGRKGRFAFCFKCNTAAQQEAQQ